MTEPDRLSALSQRITALTGRTLPRDELVIVAGRAFEHQIDLDDDGQLRALVSGLTSGGQVGGPPVSYGQPVVPTYPVMQPGYPQPAWPGVNPMMAPSYPMMPPIRAPKGPTRHPAGFIVGGILIVLAVLVHVGLTRGWEPFYGYHYGELSTWLLLANAAWVTLAVAFTLIAVNARGATRVSATVTAGAALLTALVHIAVPANLGGVPAMMLLMAPALIFAVALLVTGKAGRRSFGVFGLVTATGYGALEVLADISGFAGIFWPLLILSLAQLLFLLLFGIAVSCGTVPLGPTSAPFPHPNAGPTSGPVPPGHADTTPPSS